MQDKINRIFTVVGFILMVVTCAFILEHELSRKNAPEHELLCVKVHEIGSRHNVALECKEVNN